MGDDRDTNAGSTVEERPFRAAVGIAYDVGFSGCVRTEADSNEEERRFSAA